MVGKAHSVPGQRNQGRIQGRGDRPPKPTKVSL